MATEQEIINFKNSIDSCLNHTPESLMRKAEWGAYNFEDIQNDLRRFFQLVNSFSTLPYDLLPDGRLGEFNNHLQPVVTTIGQISTFNIVQSNPGTERDRMARDFKSQSNSFYNVAHIYIPYLAFQRGDIDANIAKFNEVIKKY